MASGSIIQSLPMVPTEITLSADDMTFDPKLSLYGTGANKIISFGTLNIVYISIKIDNATSRGALNIDNYIPVGYRPKSATSAIVSSGLADGHAQDVTVYTSGKLSVFPVNLNTVTYASGMIIYTT